MKKSTMVGRLAVVLLLLAPVTAFATDNETGNMNLPGSGMECHSLIDQFDALHTKNVKALALRKKAGNNCADAARTSHTDAVAQMKMALKMVGVEPSR